MRRRTSCRRRRCMPIWPGEGVAEEEEDGKTHPFINYGSAC